MLGKSSPITVQIFKNVQRDFKSLGKFVFPVVLLKIISYVTVFNRNIRPLSILSIAPSRCLKSRTNDYVRALIGKNKIIADYGSDFTIHSLAKEKLGNKCIFIDDGTVLFESKQGNRKLRLQAALAQLISEGQYVYSDKTEKWKVKGRIAIVMNMAELSFVKNRESIIKSTFINRFLTVNYRIPSYVERIVDLNLPEPLDLNISSEDIRFDDIHKIGSYFDYENYGLGENSRDILSGVFKNFLKGHAALNGRDAVNDDDFEILRHLSSFFKVPIDVDSVCFIGYWNGYSTNDISYYLHIKENRVEESLSRILRNEERFVPVFDVSLE